MSKENSWYDRLQGPADVDKTPPEDGEALIWDSLSKLWRPQAGLGISGFSGYSGYSGSVGPQGTSGYSGAEGPQGTSGYSGYSGYLPDCLKLDTSNGPLTGNLGISKSSPELRLTDTGSDYARILRVSLNDSLQLLNRISIPIDGKAIGTVPNYYAYTSDSLLPTGANPRTMALWVKFNSTSGEQVPISYGHNNDGAWQLLMMNGTLYFHAWNYYPSFGSVADSNWHLCIFIYDGTNVKVYWDNVSSLNQAHALNTDSTSALWIGKCTSGASRYFNGEVDELGFWNRALDASECALLWNSGNGLYGDTSVAPFDSGFIVGWHFDEGTGTSAAAFNTTNAFTLDANMTWETGKVEATSGLMTEVNVLVSDDYFTTLGNSSVPTKIGSFSTAGVVQSAASGELSVNNTLTDITLAGTTYATNGLLTILPPESDASCYIDIYPSATSGDNNWSAIYAETYGSAKWLGLFADESGVYLTGSEPIKTDQDLDLDGNDLSANVIESTVATGTAPFTVASTTVSTNLNADLLDGQHLGYLPSRTITASTDTPSVTDYILYCDTTSNGITINLPASANYTNKVYIIKVINATNSVILDPNSSETIDGQTTITLTLLNETITIHCNGSNWHIIGE